MVEAGLGHLPFTEKTVITPTGHPYVGVDFAKKLCGVSIIRSGESMEPALRACCKGIKIGKILVHRERVGMSAYIGKLNGSCEGSNGTGTTHTRRPSSSGSDQPEEHEIVYEKLPTDIADRFVLLMDPILASGHSAQRAIQVYAFAFLWV